LLGGVVDIQSRLDEGRRVTVRLPLECEGGRSESDPVKLVTNRNRSFPMVANARVKKSA
jgi:two-component system, cell cycle sensor histidine kinase DivJ